MGLSPTYVKPELEVMFDFTIALDQSEKRTQVYHIIMSFKGILTQAFFSFHSFANRSKEYKA